MARRMVVWCLSKRVGSRPVVNAPAILLNVERHEALKVGIRKCRIFKAVSSVLRS